MICGSEIKGSVTRIGCYRTRPRRENSVVPCQPVEIIATIRCRLQNDDTMQVAEWPCPSESAFKSVPQHAFTNANIFTRYLNWSTMNKSVNDILLCSETQTMYNNQHSFYHVPPAASGIVASVASSASSSRRSLAICRL